MRKEKTVMTAMAQEEGSAPRGRPRSAASRQTVLQAAYAILIEEGLVGFSVEAVAARAGVARTTIYRWWPTKGLLAFDSFREAFGAQLVFARTDAPAADLRALVRSLARALAGPAGRLAASVMAQAQSDPEVQKLFLEQFSLPLRRHSAGVLKAGIAAGVFRSDLKVGRLLDALVGAVYLRLMFGLPLDASWADALAETLLGGCMA
jgi:AcrR family transcriptional regulator